MFTKNGKKIIHNVRWFLFSLTLGLFLGGGLIAVNAWTDPIVAPPGGNIAAPINISSITQTKSGRLNMVGSVLSSPSTALLVPIGNVGIGDNTPDVGDGGQLRLDVAGNIGATRYCDQNGNNCTTSTNLGGGVIKAWVNFDGDTAPYTTIRDSFNVSNIAYQGGAVYRVNWQNDFANTRYAIFITTSSGPVRILSIQPGYATFQVFSISSTPGTQMADIISVAAMDN